MSATRYIVRGSCLISLIALLAGCVIAPAPREGYYDRPNDRYYHDHEWHDCRGHDERGDRGYRDEHDDRDDRGYRDEHGDRDEHEDRDDRGDHCR